MIHATDIIEPDRDHFVNACRLTANTLRVLAAEGVQRANSGHPGLPMGMADVATVLWSRHLLHDPAQPEWWDRDRFVLSAGHGSMLLYSLLHLSGYDLSIEDIKQFRQLHSRTPGHPEHGLTRGVETTTGPLGQGLGNAVGMAIAERWLAARFNRPGFTLFDHNTYVIASDGDLMEGISHEACSLAGHLALGKLIVLYDDNGISIDGPTSLSFSENVPERFAAYGWQVQQVNGHNVVEVDAAIQTALESGRPSLIACKTRIGFSSPNRENTSKAHGEPLGAEEVRLVKKRLGWPLDEEFYIPADAREQLQSRARAGGAKHAAWREVLEKYHVAYPDLYEELLNSMNGVLPEGWERALPDLSASPPMATRAASGAVIDALAPALPALIGGSADLTPSNNTQPKGHAGSRLASDNFDGYYVHFGVREHAMGAIMNGLALHGGVRPYGGTFLIFSDYMRSPIRMAALMQVPAIFVFTHDSVGLGEDGPTHQPVEQLTSLRAIPNLVVLRPADAIETVAAWRVALERTTGPTALVLTRQSVPLLSRNSTTVADPVKHGAYILADAEQPAAIIIATGSEVQLAVEAAEQLRADNIAVRIVSMPSCELFEQQDRAYRDHVLPPHLRARVAVEAGSTLGWGTYVGLDGEVVGIDRFGASAPGAQVFRDVGVTAEAVAHAVRRTIARAPQV